MPGRGHPAGHRRRNTVVAYVIRRLIAAVMLLVLVSIITFSIFYLVPRWAGATPETLATRYVGRTATADTVKLTAERLGFYDPFYKQYAGWAKTVVAGGEFDMGAQKVQCPAPCLGYSFITRQPVWPDLLDRLPVTFSWRVGAAVIWLVMGVPIGVLSALKTRHVRRPRRHDDRARRRLAADLLHRLMALTLFWSTSARSSARSHATPTSPTTRSSGRRV